MSLIANPAPSFSIEAVSRQADQPWQLAPEDYRGDWLLLLFYPRDFSFVCPTELTSFSARYLEFAERNCNIVGISVDGIESHRRWLETPADEGGLGPLQFPLASDPDGAVAKAYGIWIEPQQVSARGLFLIDPEGVLQYAVVHNLAVGRSVDEILRVLSAMQTGGLCPASWTTADGNLDPEKALQPGRVLGHYRIERLIGQGSYGTVFSTWDLHLERRVAIKVLKRNVFESRDVILREARAAAPLHHPNTCQVYSIEEVDGLPLIAMEYIEGRTLKEISRELSPEERLQLARGIVDGLAAAHAIGIVHGDLKPANILVGENLVPRILDFGLARQQKTISVVLNETTDETPAGSEFWNAIEEMEATVPAETASSNTSAGGVTGTPAYMAPEQWSGQPATLASDIFSFGLTFYELMTGNRALADRRVNEIVPRLNAPNFAASLAGELDSPFREVVQDSLARTPNARPAAEHIRKALWNVA